jgi:transitional endoplasmic reticulum ATPase
LILRSNDNVEDGKITMNKVARNNLRVKLSDIVSVHACKDIKNAERLDIRPFEDSIRGLSRDSDLFEVYLKPYFYSLDGMSILAFCATLGNEWVL